MTAKTTTKTTKTTSERAGRKKYLWTKAESCFFGLVQALCSNTRSAHRRLQPSPTKLALHDAASAGALVVTLT
jgi:hypothetical protein